MAAPIAAPRRPLLALSFLLPLWSESATLVLRRNQSSYRRTTKRLRVKPDASFGPSTQSQNHIVYNPPSSSPSVYHTPTKFLPANDLRRRLRADSPAEKPAEERLPLVFNNSHEKTYHLTATEIEEIRQLRLRDPMTWSRWKLARRYGCSPLFIAMVCEASPQKKEIQKQVLEAVQSRWGAKRRIAREDRMLRKETWARDE